MAAIGSSPVAQVRVMPRIEPALLLQVRVSLPFPVDSEYRA